jgi:hypothetical protein
MKMFDKPVFGKTSRGCVERLPEVGDNCNKVDAKLNLG